MHPMLQDVINSFWGWYANVLLWLGIGDAEVNAHVPLIGATPNIETRYFTPPESPTTHHVPCDLELTPTQRSLDSHEEGSGPSNECEGIHEVSGQHINESEVILEE
ncbi:hypothetical protein HanIR_Chr08g0356651 [Helianthus annuus]|nr:hypothetical protein HanIR_Chr08g0356651 [Helianthus annuus]